MGPGRRALALALLWACVAGGAAVSGRADTECVLRAAELLGSPDHVRRIEGLALLESETTSTRAEELAVGALEDPDWEVQIRAAQVLGKIAHEPGLEALRDHALGAEIQWVRDAAVEGLLVRDRTNAATRLLESARNTRDDVRKARALRTAVPLVEPHHLSKVRPFLKSKDIYVQEAASACVARLYVHEEVREEVAKALDRFLDKRDDKKFFLAYVAAVEGVGLFDVPEARTLLVDELVRQTEEDGYVVERIARALARMAPEGAVEALRRGLAQARQPLHLRNVLRVAAHAGLKDLRADVEGLLAHKDERVRSEALRCLSTLADPASATAVEPLLDDKSPYVRIEALGALARLLPRDRFRALGERMVKDKETVLRLQYVVEVVEQGDPAGIEVLVPFLEDKSWRPSTAAAAGIGTLGVADDLPKLEPLTGSRNWKLRAAAFEGMGRLRAAQAIPLLAEGLKDRDPVVQGVCHANLQILTRADLGPKADLWRDWWSKNGDGLLLVKRSRMTQEEKAKEAAEEERYVWKREKGIEVLQKARLLVITGAWDKVERVLEHLQIPCTVMRAQELKDAGLNPNQILLVNCEGNMDKDTQDRVRWFVNVGGVLMSTDWALTKTVEPCFQGYMAQFSGSSTGNDVVVVEEGSPGHRFTEGVFDGVPALKWWLEIQAFPITITYPERCRVLVDSRAMRQRYGSSPLAATFQWGLGKVVHSVSHFYLQEEGLEHARSPLDRRVFLADNLGLSLEQIRELTLGKELDRKPNDETMKKIAGDYSMFRMIVNVVREKADWVENL